MEQKRNLTVQVIDSLHARAKQESEANGQTWSQYIEMVLQSHFDRKEGKEKSGNTRTLAFQVGEDFFTEVQEHIKANGMKLKDFGIGAMRCMMTAAPDDKPEPAEPVMSGTKRTLAFQVSEEFFAEVQDYIKANGMKLKDFGIEAMRRMMAGAPDASPEPAETSEQD